MLVPLSAYEYLRIDLQIKPQQDALSKITKIKLPNLIRDNTIYPLISVDVVYGLLIMHPTWKSTHLA